MKPSRLPLEARLALIYMLFGGLWIILSDRLLAALSPSPASLTRLQTYKGELFVLASAALIYVLLGRALARQRSAEERHREEEARYRLLFETSLDAILITAAGESVLAANPAACRMFQRSEAEICEAGRSGLVDPADSRLDRLLEQRAGTGRYTGELTFVRKDGTYFPAEVSTALFEDKLGRSHASLIIRDISHRKQAEAALNASHEQLRMVMARLAELQAVERRSLAKELHDRVGQSLTTLGVTLNLIRARLAPEAQQEAARRFDVAQDLVTEVTDEVRAVIAQLHPPVLDDYGLAAALRWHAERLQRQTGLQVEVTGELIEPRIPLNRSVALFRIAQEALNNVVKHAGVERAAVRLECAPEGIRLTIADEGHGFDLNDSAAQAAQGDGHWGLLTMRERAEALDGSLQIDTAPGRGARIIATIPR